MKIKPTLLLGALVAAALSLCLVSALKAQNAEELREEFHRTLPLTAQGRITLENISGTVKITAWERNEVKIDAVKRAYSRERLAEAQINVNANADSVDIHTEYPERNNYTFNSNDDRRNSLASVDYTLVVPRTARLEGIELVNGNLEITGTGGDVKASVVNGQVTARGLVGDARLSTVNGRLEATFDRLDAAKSISLGSVNGQLTLVIPSDASAQLRANTVSGLITNDFGLPVRRGDYVGRDLAGTLGSGGGPRIKLSNVSGAIAIKHAADNRPLSPSMNQLPESRDDNGDEGDDSTDMATEARREARRAARVAARDSARAQIEAQRATRAAQVEVQREARAARAAAARDASREQQDTVRDAREARMEAERAVRAAQLDALKEKQEAIRESQRAVIVNRREIERASRTAARDAREAALRAGLDENEDLRLVERESKSFSIAGVPRVVLNTFDGRISVRAWDKPEVSLTAIKRASNEQALRGISVKATQQGGEVSIQTDYDKSAVSRTGNVVSTNASVTLEVFVPRNTNLKAFSGDGRVELEGVTGGVTLQTEDGRIEVRNGGGQLIAKTGDGRIEVLNYTGDVDARTEDGRINLEGSFAQLAAHTGEGSILLALPSDLDATIETDAEEVTGDGIAVAEEGGSAGKKLRRFKIGRGGTLFRLQTGAGNVYLRRR